MKLTSEERKAITALKQIAARWPKTLWLFATGDALNVMRVGKDGERVFEPGGGGCDPNYIADTIVIPSDGGDW